MSTAKRKLIKLVLSAMFIALALVLPFLTGQVPQIGNLLCPMHIPVLLCGFICGPWYGFAVGAISPLLRFLCFGMPPLIPTGLAMCFELAAYGSMAGLFYKYLPKKRINIYLSLVSAMLIGRMVWGLARYCMYILGSSGLAGIIGWEAAKNALSGMGSSVFGWSAFFAGAFTNAVPGIILQLILIPLIIMALQKPIRSIKT